MAKRTFIEFDYSGDVWPIIESWAKENGYRAKGANGATRLFQKGIGFLAAPMMLSAEASSGHVQIQAWVRCNLLVRISALFILPSEMSIESGGMRAALPRKIARTAVNKLLAQFSQPAIP